jgi:putative transposase
VNVYPFIEAEKAQQRNVKRACELLKVSRAAYYAARDGQPSGRDREDAELTVYRSNIELRCLSLAYAAW